MRRSKKSTLGFSLLELLISAAIGGVLVVAAAQVFSRGMKASWVTSQRAELQQDFRAAGNLMQRDISMAGSGALGQQGLSTSSVGLPTGIRPVYPCTGLSTCNYIAGAPVAYPLSGGSPYLYSIIPGPNFGITINAAQGPTDILTVVYADANLALNCYTGAMNAAGTVVTFQLPATLPTTCVLPSSSPVTPAPLTYNAVGNPTGLQIGDMIMFGTNALGVVTSNVATCAPTGTNTACYTATFAATDPGHINQPGTPVAGNLKQFASAATPSAVRLIAVTYYLDISPSDGVTPRLMRLQSGQLPAPVAENVVYLKFSFDVYNAGAISANQASLPAGTNPGMITKVNIVHMSMRSQANTYNGYQGLDLQTSIAARNLTSQQEYPISGTAY
jgi:prepilin-type N-terminal cleavage/methylation domain-containing protein